MPRQRTTAGSDRVGAAEPQSPGAGAFVCPECGKSFTRAASLGAHRRRSHGVAGAAAQTSRRISSKRGSSTSAEATQSTPRRRRRRAAAAKTHTRVTRPSATDGGRATVDRDALLAALFPAGVPARAEVIQAVSQWLEEADRLAGMR